MNLQTKIHQQLTQLAASSADEVSLSIDVENGRLECHLTAIDSMSCSFRLLELQTSRLSGTSVQQLKELSEALSKRLSYLLEPIGVVEADDEQCVVQMRSNPPQRDEDATSYYELLLRSGGTISLCRYTKNRGDVRQTVPAMVTREVLARLATDFVEAVA